MRALNRVFKGRARGDQPTLPEKVKRILRKYGATLLMPGPSGILQYGFQPGNYRESTGQTLAAVDQQVGFVVDAAQSPGPELMTNGDFSNGLTGWSSIGTGGTRTVVSGRVQITGGVGPGLRQGGLISGRAYRASMYARRISGTANAFVTGGGLNPAGATVTWVFNASATNFDFGISGDSSTTTWEFGEISVRELTGIHASQSTSGYQPYLRQSGGVNSWQFDGTDDRLSLSAVPFQTQDVSFAITAFNPSISDALARRIWEIAGNGSETYVAVSNSKVLLQTKGDAGNTAYITSAGNVTPGVAKVVSLVLSPTSRILRIDGQLDSMSSVSLNNSTSNVATLGNRAAGDRASGGFQHLQIFGKGAITDAELLVLEKFAAKLQGRNL